METGDTLEPPKAPPAEESAEDKPPVAPPIAPDDSSSAENLESPPPPAAPEPVPEDTPEFSDVQKNEEAIPPAPEAENVSVSEEAETSPPPPPAPDANDLPESSDSSVEAGSFGNIDDEVDPNATWPEEPNRLTEDDVDKVLLWSVQQGSSDISFQSDRVLYNEIGGELRPGTKRKLDGSDMATLVSKIYGSDGMARLAGGNDLDISYEIRPDRNIRFRFRVNITAILSSGRDGVQITMRVLPTEPPTMEQLGIEQELIDNWDPRDGIVLVTGPTGSGKSTLLAAGNRMMIERPQGCGKMLTYEAPIEYTYDTIVGEKSLIAQTEIPRHLKSFEHGVRNALRRKPEIILVGEARDRETIAAAIEAGQTGHAVYSTVHTTGVANTIRRMVSTFTPDEREERAYSLMETMRLIVTQILVPKKGGGRLGLREWLVFDDDLREKLLDMEYDKWSVELMRIVPQRGRSMAQSAKIALENDEIDVRHYKVVTKGAGGH